MEEKKPVKKGRPSSYKPEYIATAKAMSKLGATEFEIAQEIGCSIPTLTKWQSENPAFLAAVKLPKVAADARVERRLYARAMGYEHDEIDIRVVDGKLVKTPIKKFYPPDTVAAIFWLKNRKTKEWRDIKAVELSGDGGGPVRIVATRHDENL